MPDGDLLDAHGRATTLDKARKLGVDVAATNADGTDTVPMPTVVIVDTTGTTPWIDGHPDFTTRTEPGEILAALDALGL